MVTFILSAIALILLSVVLFQNSKIKSQDIRLKRLIREQKQNDAIYNMLNMALLDAEELIDYLRTINSESLELSKDVSATNKELVVENKKLQAFMKEHIKKQNHNKNEEDHINEA